MDKTSPSSSPIPDDADPLAVIIALHFYQHWTPAQVRAEKLLASQGETYEADRVKEIASHLISTSFAIEIESDLADAYLAQAWEDYGEAATTVLSEYRERRSRGL